jgi:hypothetical protein
VNPHFSRRTFSTILLISMACSCHASAIAKRRRPPAGGRIAIVVDERLSVLRSRPELSGKLLQRLGRGRLVAIRAKQKSREGVIFYLVMVSRRTHGWIQREAIVSAAHAGDDESLMRLVTTSEGFDRIARARIFLDTFTDSRLRPAVLMLFAEAAEEAAVRLSRDASRRLNDAEVNAGDAPQFSYFLNYNGLDRYSRQGIGFVFDRGQKKFHYDGASWREIIRRYPRSHEADEARKRLDAITSIQYREW